MAVEISINNLNSWLDSQSNNTANTAYSVKIVDLTISNVSDVKTALINNPTKYVDLRETIFPQCDLKELFQNCVTLVNSPNTIIINHERSYGSTQDVYIQNAFEGCSSLKSFSCRNSYQLVNPNNNIDSGNVFNGCTNLTDFYSDNPYYMKQWITSIQSSSRFPNAVSDCNFYFIDNYDYIICQVNDLSNLLQMLPQNTISTAYKIKLSSVNNNNKANLTTALLSNLDKYVDLSETIINIESGFLTNQFKDCTNLVYAPKISKGELTSTFKGCTNLKSADLGSYSNSLNRLDNTFSGCSSLTEVTLPNTIKRFNNNVFEGCSALNTLKISTLNSSTSFAPTAYTDVFKDCSNLLNFYCDSPYQVKTWLTTIHNASTDNFPNDPDMCNYFFYSELSTHIIPFSQLNDTLEILQANTADTAYNIKVTELTSSDITWSQDTGTLGYVLNENNTKYVNLSETILPSKPLGMHSSFEGCSSLVVSPKLPSDVPNLSYVFLRCTSLKEPPTIPNSVTSMEGTFSDCTSLVTAPVIPNGVTNMGSTFNNCTSLVTAPEIPASVNIMVGTFSDCTSLVTAPVIPNGVTSMEVTFMNCTSLVTAPVIPNGVTSIKNTFNNCTSLVTAPTIPNGVTNMEGTFYLCTSLTTVPKIPSSVENITGCFHRCSALTTFSQSQFDASNISNCERVFAFCENLTNFYCDTPYELKSWLTTLRSNSILNFPSDPDNCTFKLYSIPAVIPFAKLNNELSTLTANTASTPFKIIIPDLTDLNFGDLDTSNPTLRHVLLSNSTKYVDLSETEIPNTIDPSVGMDEAFYGCTSLVKAPILPNHITSLDKSFENCNSLTTTPVLPNSVTNLYETFKGCTSLVTVPNVPASVTDINDCFKDCSSLEEIEVFEVPLSVLKSNFAGDCFSGCTSLTKIGIRGAGRSSDWHIALLEFGATTVKGKFYDRQGNSVTIPETTIAKNKLKLPVLTDELMFNTQTSFADLESLIEDVLQYNYGYYNKFVVTPKNKQFVLYANDPENGFTTNLPFGGGGGASDHTPLGTWASFESGVAPSDKWLEAGTTFNAVDYPELYMYLNDTTVPERFDHSKLSEWESITISTNSASPTVMQYDGFLYVFTNSDPTLTIYVNGTALNVNVRSTYTNGNATIPVKKGDNVYYKFSNSSINNTKVAYYKQHLFIKATTGADVETAVSLSTSWYDALKTSMYTWENINLVSSVTNRSSDGSGGTATLVYCKINRATKKIRVRVDFSSAGRSGSANVPSIIFDSSKFVLETANIPVNLTITNKVANSGMSGSFSVVEISILENANELRAYMYAHEFAPSNIPTYIFEIDYSMCSTGYGLLES